MPRRKLDLSSGQKTCPSCKETKLLEQFHKSSDTLHGYQVYCKPCQYERHNTWRLKNLSKARDASRKWRAENPELAKEHSRKTNYGLPIGEYSKMLAAQNGRCAICRNTKAGGRGDFHVDHCHDTGRIRGLLCHGCNVGIGSLKHNVENLQSAIRYLAESG